jgi:prevent-host-death family protein
MVWKLADAKARFSEVVRLALDGEPQTIQRRDDAVVVISAEEYSRLTGGSGGLIGFLAAGPDLSKLDLERDTTPMRDVDL